MSAIYTSQLTENVLVTILINCVFVTVFFMF